MFNNNLEYLTSSLMGRHGRDPMVVGFTTTYAIRAYHHYEVVSLTPVHGEVYSIHNIM